MPLDSGEYAGVVQTKPGWLGKARPTRRAAYSPLASEPWAAHENIPSKAAQKPSTQHAMFALKKHWGQAGCCDDSSAFRSRSYRAWSTKLIASVLHSRSHPLPRATAKQSESTLHA